MKSSIAGIPHTYVSKRIENAEGHGGEGRVEVLEGSASRLVQLLGERAQFLRSCCGYELKDVRNELAHKPVKVRAKSVGHKRQNGRRLQLCSQRG